MLLAIRFSFKVNKFSLLHLTKFIYITHKVHDSNVLTTKLLTQLYVKVDILVMYEKHLHDRIISIRGDNWVYKTSLTPPYFINVPVQSHENNRSCVGVKGIDITSVLCDYSIWFLNCSDNVVFFVIHFTNHSSGIVNNIANHSNANQNHWVDKSQTAILMRIIRLLILDRYGKQYNLE
jgi:hypothetical protein